MPKKGSPGEVTCEVVTAAEATPGARARMASASGASIQDRMVRAKRKWNSLIGNTEQFEPC
jgi:hypothetical protein